MCKVHLGFTNMYRIVRTGGGGRGGGVGGEGSVGRLGEGVYRTNRHWSNCGGNR